MGNQEKTAQEQSSEMSRRHFLATTAAAATAFTIVPRHVLGGPGYQAPSDTLNVAGIGAGGKGSSDLRAAAETANIVAICDVDRERAARTFATYPRAKKYTDYRHMLEREKDNIDAVTVSTPDHNHAPAAMMAMKLGKHVFVQKPLTNTIYEARMLKEAARKYNLITQMGNQGHAGEGNRLILEWVADGAIGPVREVRCWTNRPIWPQGIDRPKETPPVPKTLDWDIWLGPAPYRPYHPAYVPFSWRGWWDFGTGALGDMACHIMDTPVWALNLGHATEVEAISTPVNEETAPLASMITFTFPARGNMVPVKLTWFDGELMAPRPPELEEGRRMGDNDGGVLLIGDKGKIMCGCYGRNPRLIPESAMAAFNPPEPTIPRVEGIMQDWINGIKTGQQPCSNFQVSGTLTEIMLLGNLALRTGKRLDWDGPNMKVTNVPEAQKYVHREYREGWTL